MNEQKEKQKRRIDRIAAFEYYYGLGANRTLELTAEYFGVVTQVINQITQADNWKQLVKDRDLEVAAELRKKK